MQVPCLTSYCHRKKTHAKPKGEKQISCSRKLPNLDAPAPFLFKKSLVCPLALAIHLAAEKETVKSSKVYSESAYNGIKRLVERLLKAFILRYAMSMEISLQG